MRPPRATRTRNPPSSRASEPREGGEPDRSMVLTVVRPNKERVAITTSMRATVESFALQFVLATTNHTETEEEQMDRFNSMRFVDSLGKQWCNSDPVGIYITPEELTDYYRIFQLFRIRGRAEAEQAGAEGLGQAPRQAALGQGEVGPGHAEADAYPVGPGALQQGRGDS